MTGPCAHVAAVLLAGCYYAYQPAQFTSTHRPVNLVAPQLDTMGMPMAYLHDLFDGQVG